MENRFERLYGKVQRSIAKSIRSRLGNDESLTMGILLFSSFSEGFYYSSTIKNTLLYPEDITIPFTEKEIWNYELMKELGIFLANDNAKTDVKNLLKENDELIKKNASFFAIVFEEYPEFKKAWWNWFSSNISKYLNPEEDLQDVSTKLFYFANYLLTIIRMPAFRTQSYIPDESSYAERIYRCIINTSPGENTGLNLNTGELRPDPLGSQWSVQIDSQIPIPRLKLALEVCFKQPFSVEQKVEILKLIVEKKEEGIQKYKISAMACPLQYNGDFQGIVYVSTNHSKRIFNDKDFANFESVIQDLHLKSILYNVKYDTARFSLEKTTVKDLEFPSLLRVLKVQHMFSSSPLGMIILSDKTVFIRHRFKGYSQTRKIEKTDSEIFSFFESRNLKFNGDVVNEGFFKDENRNYAWIDVSDPYEKAAEIKFNADLKAFLGIHEGLFVCSLTYMVFKEKGESEYYFLFNSNNLINKGINKYDSIIRQNFALQTDNNISKLLDIEKFVRRSIDIQTKISNDLQIGIIHDAKNFFDSIIHNIEDANERPTKSDIIKANNIIQKDIQIARDRFDDYIKVFKELSNENEKVELSKDDLLEIWNSIVMKYSTSKVKFPAPILNYQRDKIETLPKALRFLLKEIVTNAIKQYNSYAYREVTKKIVELRIEKNPVVDKFESFDFSIFNYGTEIAQTISETVGDEIITNGTNQSKGFGLLFVNRLLENMNAAKIGNRYFSIATVNDKNLHGVKVRFSLPRKLIR